LPQGGGRPGENKKTIPHTKRRKKKQLATGEQKTRSAGKKLQLVACHRGTEGQERRKNALPRAKRGEKKQLAAGDQKARKEDKTTPCAKRRGKNTYTMVPGWRKSLYAARSARRSTDSH